MSIATATPARFLFSKPPPPATYTLSLHDALPIFGRCRKISHAPSDMMSDWRRLISKSGRSEEHTSELQSRLHLVCRLLLETKTFAAAGALAVMARAEAARPSEPVKIFVEAPRAGE